MRLRAQTHSPIEGVLPKSARRALIVSLCMLMASCTTSVTLQGSSRYPPLAPTESVAVFLSADEIKTSFETLGVIDRSNWGKYQILTLDDAIPALKEKARAIGANAIIVDQISTIYSGFVSRGVSVRARAIRLLE